MRVGFEEAVQLLSEGKPLIFPTDTVVGIGVSVRHAQNPDALYRIKGRASGKPIAWLVGSARDLSRYGAQVPDYAFQLADRYWPGALTLVVRASDDVPNAFCSIQGTIGLRMSNHPNVTALTEALSSPLSVTSANLSGKEAVSSLRDLDPAIADSQAVFEAIHPESAKVSDSQHPTASTVLDCTHALPTVLRAGTISPSEIEDMLGMPMALIRP